MNIKSIAQKTGYSESTVSRALNNDPRISDRTTKLIQEMATKLNYQKDFAAMNLNHQESNILAVIFPPEDYMNINNPFYIEIIKQASYVAAKYNYMISVILAQNPDELGQKIDMMMAQGKVRKFIMLYNLPNDPLIGKFDRQDVNLVVIGNPLNEQVVFVDNDNYQVGRAVAQTLLQDKKQTPVYIMSQRKWKFEMDRQRGIISYLQDHNCQLQTIEFDETSSAVTSQLKQLGHENRPIIVSSDDLLAKLYGILNFNAEQTIISFNNSIFIQPVSQNIKSVDLHPHEMGNKAAKLLFEGEFAQVKKANYVGFTI